MDDAAIYTIHGWSRRMLSQHALDSRNLFEQTHLENAEDLQRALVQDYWREWFYPLSAQALECISPFIGNAPDVLLNKVRTVWTEIERKPSNTDAPAFSPHQIIDTHLAWAQELVSKADVCRSHWNEALNATLEEVGSKKNSKVFVLTITPIGCNNSKIGQKTKQRSSQMSLRASQHLC